MIYIFGSLLVVSYIKQRELLLSKKRNLFVFIFLSTIGLVLGLLQMTRPYIPSIFNKLQEYFR